jgi:hypothetical protein
MFQFRGRQHILYLHVFCLAGVNEAQWDCAKAYCEAEKTSPNELARLFSSEIVRLKLEPI